MEKVCPRCQSSSYQVPGMKLLVNVCGHKLCESCVMVVFVHPSAPCPECGLSLRKNQFRLQQFDDSRVEIEVDIRKKILKDYNKTEEDFSTLREYNDYLEEVETIVYSISNGIDVEEMKAKIESYRKENQAIILRNKMRQQRHEQVLTTQLAQEQLEVELRNEDALIKEKETARLKKKQKESILEELIYSDLPASKVFASHIASSAMAQGEEHLSTTIGLASTAEASKTEISYAYSGTTVYSGLPTEVGNVYHYVAPDIETHGPSIPQLEELETLGYLSNLGNLEDLHLGGGFLPAYACQRSLQEAFSCLLFFPDQHLDVDIP